MSKPSIVTSPAVTSEPASKAPPQGGDIADAVRNGILDGKFRPGARLNEVHLSREFGVSRTPVRGALQTLVGEGLIDYTPNKGYSVRAFDLSEIVDAFEMRALAEGLAARLAAERGLSLENETAMAEALRLLIAAEDLAGGRASTVEEVRKVYSDANERFHVAIHNAASSRLVTDVISLCSRVPLTLTRNIIDFELDKIKDRNEEHQQVFDAILSRKPKEAEALMYEHDQGVRRALIRVLANHRRNQ
jgi:GntR family transcriptional regulator of vanillate catabolism